ncbi:MAG: glycerol dehydrogenase [Pseudomonadota bacterium]
MDTFFPPQIYLANNLVPRVMVAPPKYIQGPGCLQAIGSYMSVLDVERIGVLASARGHSAQAGEVTAALQAEGMTTIPSVFGGECSLQEIEARAAELREKCVDCLVTIGGGKCVDAGKSIAGRVDVPLVVVPTLASNDAPTSAVSVLYTPEGVNSGAEFFPNNPVLVVVDTAVVAQASERYLVAGMGDAMATWYEAKVCIENPSARTILGGRPTLAAAAIGETCAVNLFAHGLDACMAVRDNHVNESLEAVVEANTLLSGLGFESGGLACAHGIAQGLTTLPEVEHNFLHGEMVAYGVLTQLMLQRERNEARRVAEFFVTVGLPVTLAQIGVDDQVELDIEHMVQGTMAFTPLANLPFSVDAPMVEKAIRAADALGHDVITRKGDSAYQALHAV